jgi:hypothetical protein
MAAATEDQRDKSKVSSNAHLRVHTRYFWLTGTSICIRKEAESFLESLPIFPGK